MVLEVNGELERTFGDVCVCVFLEAGPEITPGFSPVYVLGDPFPDDEVEEGIPPPEPTEPEPTKDTDDSLRLLLFDLRSFVRVLLIVSFMPSELGFTMYSVGFFMSPDGFLPAGFAEAPAAPGAKFEPELGPSSVQCWAFFNLSMTALSDPLRFLACCWLASDLLGSEGGVVLPPPPPADSAAC